MKDKLLQHARVGQREPVHNALDEERRLRVEEAKALYRKAWMSSKRTTLSKAASSSSSSSSPTIIGRMRVKNVFQSVPSSDVIHTNALAGLTFIAAVRHPLALVLLLLAQEPGCQGCLLLWNRLARCRCGFRRHGDGRGTSLFLI